MAAVVGSSSSSPASGDQNLSNLAADALPLIDLRLLSQSELLSLAICSASFASVHNLHNDTDISTPRIDRSVFNESAGSRKQTFSRLRLARRGSSRRASDSPSTTATHLHRQSAEVQLDEESRQIVSGLKSLFGVVDSGSGQSGDLDNLASPDGGEHDRTLALPSNSTGGLQIERMNDASSSSRRDIEQPVVVLAIAAEPVTPSPKKRKRGRPSRTDTNLHGNRSKANGLVSQADNQIVLVPDGAEPIAPSPKKRKRGRPSKTDTNLHGNRSSSSKVNGLVSLADNQIVLVPEDTENNRHEEQMAMVIVNENAIDLAAVAAIQDPYGDRLRNSTAGMRTKEEVLEFLQGIQGEWVSSRRKRKIVDASAFGDLLPSGWKLLIRVTRRKENVWLDCGRYISPNGQQFVSFKEVGSYLHSASELQDATLSNFGVVDGNVRVTSQNSAENMSKDDTNGCAHPSTWSVSPTRPIESKEDTYALEIGSLDEFQAEKSCKCHKCRMAFNQPDELLEHLVTSHPRTPKRVRCGTALNEEAIIKDGKYECQLCRKTFDERHRFNGHFGNHVKDYLKRSEGSLAKGKFQKGAVLSPSSVASPLPSSKMNDIHVCDDVPSKGAKCHGSVRFKMAERASDAETNAEITHGVPCATKVNDCVINYNHKKDQVSTTCPDEGGRTNERNGIVHTVNSPSFRANSILLDENKNNAIRESSNGAELCRDTADDIDCLVGLEIYSQDTSFATSAGHNSHETCNTRTKIKKDELNRSPVSSSVVINNVEKIIGGRNVEDRNTSSTEVEGTKINGADPAEEEVPFAGHVVGGRIEEDVTTNIPEQTVQCCLPVPFVSDEKHGFVNSTDRILTRTMVGAVEAKSCKEDSCLTLDQITLGLTNGEKILQGSVETRCRTDVVEKSRDSYLTLDRRSGNSLPFEYTVSSGQNGRYGSHLVKPFDDPMFCAVSDIKETPRSNICRLPEEKAADDDCQLALSCSDHFSGLKTDVVKVSRGEGESLRCDKAVFSERNYFGFDTALPSGYLANAEEERSSTSLSHMSSANGQSYAHNIQAHGDVDQVNHISSMTVDSRHKNANSSYVGEQSTYYGHACATQNSVTVRNRQEAFPAVIVGHNRRPMDDDPRPKDGSMEDFLPFPYNNQVGSFENDLNRAFPHTEDLGNLRKKSMEFGFYGDARTNGNAATMGFMWKTDEESNLLGGFADTSQPVLSSNSRPPYDPVQRKVATDLFGFKFEGGVSESQGLRLGNMDNVGFNFLDSLLTAHSEGPYADRADQEFDSSSTKEALPLLPKMGSRHDLPIVCISCRKMFHYRAPGTRSGSGSDGFICAVCNANFPGRLSLQ